MEELRDEIVIIGSGLAGYGIVRELRKLNENVSITVVTKDDGAFYSKPRLSNHLSSGKDLDTLVSISGETMATKNSFNLLSDHDITSIDRAKKIIRTDKGDIHYGKLVVALGSKARAPSYSCDSFRVHSVNSLGDYQKFHAQLQGSSKVIIYGGGLVACEFANDLATAGFEVHLICRDTALLGRLVGATTSDQLLRSLQRIGVKVSLNEDIVSIKEKQAQGVVLELSQAGIVFADLVLNAIGLVPHPLLKGLGLEVNKGLRVNEFLQSSDPNIYALGDVAEYPTGWLPFVMPITHAAKICAGAILGEKSPLSFPPMPVTVKTSCYPLVIGSTTIENLQQTSQFSESGSVEEWQDSNGTLRAFVLGGDRCGEKGTFLKRWLP